MTLGNQRGPTEWKALLVVPVALGGFGLLLGALIDLIDGGGMNWDATGILAAAFAVFGFVVSAVFSAVVALDDRKTSARNRARARASVRSIDGLSQLADLDRARLRKFARRARHRSRATGTALILCAPVLAIVVAMVQFIDEGVLDAIEVGFWPFTALGVTVTILAGAATLVLALVRGASLLRPRIYLVLGQVYDHASVPLDGGYELTELEVNALELEVGQCYRIDRYGGLTTDAAFFGRRRLKGRASVVATIPVGQLVALICREPGEVIVAVL